MDKSQFQLPHNEKLYREIEQSYAAEAPTATPEIIRAPFQYFKDIDTVIDSARDTAIAIEQRNGYIKKIKYTPFTAKLPARDPSIVMADNINKERNYMSRNENSPFAEKGKYTIWKGEKHASLTQDKGVDDWYIEELVPGKTGVGVITHLEEDAVNGLRKYNHNGQAVPVTIGDYEVFIPLVYNYANKIMDLYPSEKARAKVLLDGIKKPDITALLPPTKADFMRAA